MTTDSPASPSRDLANRSDEHDDVVHQLCRIWDAIGERNKAESQYPKRSGDLVAKSDRSSAKDTERKSQPSAEPAHQNPVIPFGRLPVSRKNGDEPFTAEGQPVPWSLLDFWQWAGSDLLNNTDRDRLAEYLVAKALGLKLTTRTAWTECDLITESGVKVEVKSAAYLQTWDQDDLSEIRYHIGLQHSWNPDTNQTSAELNHGADVYVFALLAHTDKAAVCPLELGQWAFYVVTANLLNERLPERHDVSLKNLETVCGAPVRFHELARHLAQITDG